MKKIYKSFLLSLGFLLSGHTFATIHNISIVNFQFSPNTLSVNVGDTIEWTVGSGSHTTTSTTIPAGAISWNSGTISSSSPAFQYVVDVEGTYNYKCTPHNFTGQFVAINTGIKSPTYYSGFSLSFIRPSVFNVDYSLMHSSEVKITLYDVTGKSVRVYLTSRQVAGEYTNTFYLDDLQRGIYIVEMLIDNQRLSKRLIVD